MERVSRLLGKLKFPGDSVSGEELACAAWSAAVGERIAKHARAEKLVRTRLIVGVDDAVWGRQLFAMSKMILSRLAQNLGEGLVDDLEFRVSPPRRGPGRAASADGVSSGDEAASIEDPNLRRLYVAKRKKELA